MEIKLKNLSVRVVYMVELGDITAPKKVIEQLKMIYDKSQTMDAMAISEYPDAAEWLSDNIKERDCFDWECELEDFEESPVENQI